MKKEQILYSSDDAAKYVKDIEGWVDRNGLFFGKDGEHGARYSGCTHRDCEDCGKPAEKWCLVCKRCKAARDTKRYQEREQKEWDGETPLYSESHDRFFFNEDDLYDFIRDVEPLNQRLVICDPVNLSQIDHDHWCDELCEDGELPSDVEDALDELNKVITESDPVSWQPGKFAAIVK
jgi:hypothetical protein